MASDSAPLPPATPADPVPKDGGSEEAPDVEAREGAAEVPWADASEVPPDEEDAFAEAENEILPPDDASLGSTTLPAGGEGQDFVDAAVAIPAAEVDGVGGSVEKGDRGLEGLSESVAVEENSCGGVVEADEKIGTAESVGSKDGVLGGGLFGEANSLVVSEEMADEGGELFQEANKLASEEKALEGGELFVEANNLVSEEKAVEGKELFEEANNLVSEGEKLIEGGELSVEANSLISEGAAEEKSVHGELSNVGTVVGAEDDGIPISEKYEDSIEMDAPAAEEDSKGTETDGSIKEVEGGGDFKSVPSQSDFVEAEKVEASNRIDSGGAGKSGLIQAVSEGTLAADSHDFNQIFDYVGLHDDGEGNKSSHIKSEIIDNTSSVDENGISGDVSGEEEELFVGASEMASTDGIIGVYETEEVEQEEGFVSDGPARVAILESSRAAKKMIEEMEENSSDRNGTSDFVDTRDYINDRDDEIIVESESDEEVDMDGDGEGIFDSAALTALLKAAAGASSDESIAISSQDAGRILSADAPVGLGSSGSSLKPVPQRSMRSGIFAPSELSVFADDDNMDEEERKLHEKVDQIRVKFLRLVQRLGHSPEDTVAAQVLYRLGLAEGIRRGRQTSRSFSLESANKKALQLEVDGKEELDFSCNILVLGKTGVGKSATVNSLFGDSKTRTNAFEPTTTYVKEISGTLEGVKIRVIDTPGLRTNAMEQSLNKKILSSINKFTKKCPPDIVLYVDRLDSQTRDLNDVPLLRTITSTLGSSIWFNAIVALTHAASAPPEGSTGSPLSYEMFLSQRSHVIQHCIRQAAGDMRLMNPVALVENHPSCRRNREGEKVLPNGLSWRPQMLLLCYSSKILSEANSLLKLQDPSPGKLFNFRLRSPPLPFLLSSLLQSKAHPKLSAEQGGENDDSDVELDDLDDINEDEDEYDQLPPFKPLRKSQIAKLTKEQRKAYFDEYDYRVKLFQKKQWREELRRIKEMKKRGKSDPSDIGYGDTAEDYDQDGAPAAVPVPLPDMVLPPSFDCNNPAHRYRFLEPTSQLLTRPVLDTHGWDHDCGYDGVSIEQVLALAGSFPAAIAVQVTKDKKEFSIQLDSSIAAKHGENGSTLAGFDIQTVGRQLAYILRGETKFNNFKRNKTAGGISVTFLGETVATGLKIEDQISIGRVNLVGSTGAVRAQGDTAFGANMEVRLRDKDYPVGQALSTLGISLMKWRKDLAVGANLQSQFSVGRNSKMAVRVGLNNKLSGQITIKTSTSDQLQIALIALLPMAVSVLRSFLPGESYMAH